MKLYYSPGACSLSPHIVLAESGLAFDLEKVNLAAKKTEHGADYWKINPKGYVPTLELDNGQLLTEGPAIVQYLADLVPQKKLAPPAGTLERYRLQEWLNFISTELHKSFSPLFNPKAPDDWKSMVRELLNRRLEIVARHLEGRSYLMGEDFTVADAYLYTVLSWAKHVKLDLSSMPMLSAYMDRVAARPAVHATLVAEKLIAHP
jgi:glutathione S-transferase